MSNTTNKKAGQTERWCHICMTIFRHSERGCKETRIFLQRMQTQRSSLLRERNYKATETAKCAFSQNLLLDNVGATNGRPAAKCCEFAETIGKNVTFSAGRSMSAPTLFLGNFLFSKPHSLMGFAFMNPAWIRMRFFTAPFAYVRSKPR